MPLILAYKLPFVIHEDLYNLYKKHLPDAPFATHNDTLESFLVAMNEFLKKNSMIGMRPMSPTNNFEYIIDWSTCYGVQHLARAINQRGSDDRS